MAYNDKSAEATPAKAQSYLLAQDECAELLFWARSQKGAREAALREAPPLSRFRYLCPGTGHPAQVCTPGHGLARECRACHLRGQRRAFCRRVVCQLWPYVPCKSIPARDAPSEPGRRDCAELRKARRQGAWRPGGPARAEDGSLCLWHCGRVEGMKMRLVEYLRSRDTGLNLFGDAGDEVLPEGSVLFELPRGGRFPESLLAFLGSHELMPLGQSAGQLMAEQYLGHAQGVRFQSALAL